MAHILGSAWQGLGDVARGGGQVAGEVWEGAGDVARGAGRTVDETLINPLVQTGIGGTKAVTGVDLSGKSDKSILQQGSEAMGGLMAGQIGGFAKSLGLDPKILLIGGAIVGIIIIVMVIKK
ncbi:MAG: hypothetical protein ACXADH_05090 [Candidatus Kariarchaeaceae archaeon]|jgi:hypothetical protein